MAEKTEYMESVQEPKEDQVGHVMIADDVVTTIAAFAATETKGVTSLAGGIVSEAIGKMSRKNLQKGVKVETVDGVVNAQITIHIDYGYNIPEICATVQDKVKSAIEIMTGLTVREVNIQVAGVNVDNTGK